MVYETFSLPLNSVIASHVECTCFSARFEEVENEFKDGSGRATKVLHSEVLVFWLDLLLATCNLYIFFPFRTAAFRTLRGFLGLMAISFW